MKVLIVGILVLALGVAGVSTYLIKSFRTPEAIEQLEKEKAVPKKFVLVAERHKAMGETLTAEDMAWQPWVDEAVRVEYVVRQEGGPEAGEEGDLMQPYIGALVRFPIAAGEPLVPDKLFRRENPGFLAGALAPGMRATTIRVSEENGVAGFVFPGDRVDVLLTHNLAPQVATRQDAGQAAPGGAPPPPSNVLNWTTETILTDLKVLGIGQQVDGFDAKAKVVPTVTLEVTSDQARALTIATSLGRLTLALRPLAAGTAGADADGKVYTTDLEVSPFLNKQMEDLKAEAGRRAAAAAAALLADDRPRRASAPSAPSMTIFRGVSRSIEEVRK
jgi:pilus assembly protein CpaB